MRLLSTESYSCHVRDDLIPTLSSAKLRKKASYALDKGQDFVAAIAEKIIE